MDEMQNPEPQPNYYDHKDIDSSQVNRLQQAYHPQPYYQPPPAPLIQPQSMNINMKLNYMNGQPNPNNKQQNPINPGPSKSPTVFHIVNDSRNSPCPYCHQRAATIPRRVSSQAQIFWCFILLLFLAPLCFIPFCMQRCDDINFECARFKRIVSSRTRPLCPIW